MEEHPNQDREDTAARYDQCAEDLLAAADHARIAAQHYRDGEIPRGCAHAWAAYGHTTKAHILLDQNAILHSSKAQR